MGASGSAWIKPKKRAGLRPASLTAPPHPLFVRAGQRYFPLERRTRSRVVLRVTRVTAGEDSCEVTPEDESGRKKPTRLKIARLLAQGDGREGTYYRYIGCAAGRSYDTHAQIVDVGETWTRIVCPEWNLGIPVTLATAEVPPAMRDAGTWIACRAQLGAASPARVQPTRLGPPRRDFTPERYHPIETAALQPAAKDRPMAGERGVVLFVGDPLEFDAKDGLYVTGHPPPLRAGDRAYAAAGGRLEGWRTVQRVQPLPNGTWVSFDGEWQPLQQVAAPPRPVSGVASGEHGVQRWARLSRAEEDALRAP